MRTNIVVETCSKYVLEECLEVGIRQTISNK